MKWLKRNYYILGLIIISIVLLGFIYKDDTIMAHDISFHLANINNLVINNLKIKFIMPSLGNNLGYGIYLFYPALPHFCYSVLAKLLSFFSVSTIDSILVGNVIISILSSIAMYFLSNKIFKNKKIAFISSLIYLLFPYRLANITVRMALNENFLGLFIPIVLYSILELFSDNYSVFKFYLLFIIGYTGLILSHYVLALYFSFFVIVFIIFFIDLLFKKNRFKNLVIATLLVSILVLPNIIFIIENYGSDYLVYLDNYMTSIELINENTLSIRDFVIPTKEYDWTIPYYIYLPVIIGFLYSSYLSIKKSKSFNLLLFICSFIIFFVVSSPLIWDFLPKFMYNIQFPWRLLLILAVFVSLLAPSFMVVIEKKYFKISKYIYIFVCLSCIIPSLFLINKLSNRIYHNDYSIIDIEAGTGNINEYYPNQYLYFNDYYLNKNNVDIVYGSGNVNILYNNADKLSFEISDSDNMTVELPKIYYNGYKLVKDGKDVEIMKSEYGFIAANVDDGVYDLSYVGTHLYRFLKVVRIIFIVCGCSSLIYIILKKVRK